MYRNLVVSPGMDGPRVVGRGKFNVGGMPPTAMFRFTAFSGFQSKRWRMDYDNRFRGWGDM